MIRIGGEWLKRPETVAVMAALTGAGHQAYFVGGCVRDALAGRPVKDIDIATDARPEAVMAAVEQLGMKAVPTGIDHGTVTLVSGDIPHEVTTFRRDVETDGRRAVVAYSDDIADDAARRDFTMNALYADADGVVADPLGSGVADLRAGRVRFVGDAEARIHEDYLRILRFFRFLARFGGNGPDPQALAAIGRTLDGLSALSAERVRHEMLRLLGADDPGPAVAAMAAAGVLSRVLPGADATWLPVLVHLEAEAGVAPDPIRRLAVLGGEDAGGRWRLSKAETRRLARLKALLGAGSGMAEIGYRDGFEAAQDIALLRAAFAGAPLDDADLAVARQAAAATCPVRATDLMPDYQGAALGARLSEIEDRWIASGFTLTRDALLKT